MFSNIQTFFLLPNSHKWIFIKITLIVPLVEFSIKTIKFRHTLTVLKFFLNRNPKRRENEHNLVGQYTHYLYLYHKNFPFLGKCLARSLTLWFLLKRKGVETELKFGMKKKDEKLMAHSWIEYRGEALMTKSEVDEKYIAFSESIMTEVSK